MSKNTRFEVIYTGGSSLSNSGIQKILVDKETGVHYLYVQSGYSGGLTPLLDTEGKPIIKR